MDGVEGGEDVGVGGELGCAHAGEGEEPDGGEWAEAFADAVGAEELSGEEADEDDGGDGVERRTMTTIMVWMGENSR